MPRQPRYPSAASFVNDAAEFTPEILEALRAYARSKPWHGDREQQLDKLRVLHAALCQCSDLTCELAEAPMAVPGRFAVCIYHAATNTIYTAGRLSVVSYLFAFAGALCGDDHARRMTFAVNLYKRCFPRSFAAADLTGPYVRA